jgi:hypothetical protein
MKLLLTDERPFRLFLAENGWTGVGYSNDYYPEWLRWITFPCYERVSNGCWMVWRMKPKAQAALARTTGDQP